MQIRFCVKLMEMPLFRITGCVVGAAMGHDPLYRSLKQWMGSHNVIVAKMDTRGDSRG